MGTTLTGTTPQDTYDSLIKVTDNGPLSGSLKTLTDGLGNDSALALSTGAASVTGTLSVSGNATFDTSTLFVDAANNRVGVGTVTTTDILTIGDVGSSGQNIRINNLAATPNSPVGSIKFFNGISTGFELARIEYGLGTTNVNDGTLQFYLGNSGSFSPVMTMLQQGNVGIGTSSPNVQLEVSAADNSLGGIFRLNNNRTSLFDGDQNGSIQFSNNEATAGASGVRSEITSLLRDVSGKTDVVFTTAGSGVAATEKLRILADGGITFNGDTAAANALDDYEEGTWTMGVSFGGASVGVTYSVNTGTYTKIGRQVTVNGYVALTNKGSSTGAARITGLPFTIPNSANNYSVPSLLLVSISFADQYSAIGQVGFTNIELYESLNVLGATTALTNADFTNSSEIYLSFTYFV